MQLLKCPRRFTQHVVQFFRHFDVPEVDEALQSQELEFSSQTQCMQVHVPEVGKLEVAQQCPFSEAAEHTAGPVLLGNATLMH